MFYITRLIAKIVLFLPGVRTSPIVIRWKIKPSWSPTKQNYIRINRKWLKKIGYNESESNYRIYIIFHFEEKIKLKKMHIYTE